MTNAPVSIDVSNADRPWPLVVRGDGQPLDASALPRRPGHDALIEHGAVLFRGFRIGSPSDFRAACETLSDDLLDYIYRSTPRTSVSDHVYTATEYRADADIPMHNENAYQRDWPMQLIFGCLMPAASGGETPLARMREVTSRIDPDVVRTFARRGVLYVRNYGQGVDLSWQSTFQTSSTAEVEAYCRREGIAYEWLPDGCLRTKQACQGVARHPITGDELWFNQAHLFHISSLGAEQRDIMLSKGEGADRRPRMGVMLTARWP
jgi:alpha-ketoglutarate-dependent taurine dioxygenase